MQCAVERGSLEELGMTSHLETSGHVTGNSEDIDVDDEARQRVSPSDPPPVSMATDEHTSSLVPTTVVLPAALHPAAAAASVNPRLAASCFESVVDPPLDPARHVLKFPARVAASDYYYAPSVQSQSRTRTTESSLDKTPAHTSTRVKSLTPFSLRSRRHDDAPFALIKPSDETGRRSSGPQVTVPPSVLGVSTWTAEPTTSDHQGPHVEASSWVDEGQTEQSTRSILPRQVVSPSQSSVQLDARSTALVDASSLHASTTSLPDRTSPRPRATVFGDIRQRVFGVRQQSPATTTQPNKFFDFLSKSDKTLTSNDQTTHSSPTGTSETTSGTDRTDRTPQQPRPLLPDEPTAVKLTSNTSSTAAPSRISPTSSSSAAAATAVDGSTHLTVSSSSSHTLPTVAETSSIDAVSSAGSNLPANVTLDNKVVTTTAAAAVAAASLPSTSPTITDDSHRTIFSTSQSPARDLTGPGDVSQAVQSSPVRQQSTNVDPVRKTVATAQVPPWTKAGNNQTQPPGTEYNIRSTADNTKDTKNELSARRAEFFAKSTFQPEQDASQTQSPAQNKSRDPTVDSSAGVSSDTLGPHGKIVPSTVSRVDWAKQRFGSTQPLDMNFAVSASSGRPVGELSPRLPRRSTDAASSVAVDSALKPVENVDRRTVAGSSVDTSVDRRALTASNVTADQTQLQTSQQQPTTTTVAGSKVTTTSSATPLSQTSSSGNSPSAARLASPPPATTTTTAVNLLQLRQNTQMSPVDQSSKVAIVHSLQQTSPSKTTAIYETGTAFNKPVTTSAPAVPAATQSAAVSRSPPNNVAPPVASTMSTMSAVGVATSGQLASRPTHGVSHVTQNQAGTVPSVSSGRPGPAGVTSQQSSSTLVGFPGPHSSVATQRNVATVKDSINRAAATTATTTTTQQTHEPVRLVSVAPNTVKTTPGPTPGGRQPSAGTTSNVATVDDDRSQTHSDVSNASSAISNYIRGQRNLEPASNSRFPAVTPAAPGQVQPAAFSSTFPTGYTSARDSVNAGATNTNSELHASTSSELPSRQTTNSLRSTTSAVPSPTVNVRQSTAAAAAAATTVNTSPDSPTAANFVSRGAIAFSTDTARQPLTTTTTTTTTTILPQTARQPATSSTVPTTTTPAPPLSTSARPQPAPTQQTSASQVSSNDIRRQTVGDVLAQTRRPADEVEIPQSGRPTVHRSLSFPASAPQNAGSTQPQVPPQAVAPKPFSPQPALSITATSTVIRPPVTTSPAQPPVAESRPAAVLPIGFSVQPVESFVCVKPALQTVVAYISKPEVPEIRLTVKEPKPCVVHDTFVPESTPLVIVSTPVVPPVAVAREPAAHRSVLEPVSSRLHQQSAAQSQLVTQPSPLQVTTTSSRLPGAEDTAASSVVVGSRRRESPQQQQQQQQQQQPEVVKSRLEGVEADSRRTVQSLTQRNVEDARQQRATVPTTSSVPLTTVNTPQQRQTTTPQTHHQTPVTSHVIASSVSTTTTRPTNAVTALTTTTTTTTTTPVNRPQTTTTQFSRISADNTSRPTLSTTTTTTTTTPANVTQPRSVSQSRPVVATKPAAVTQHTTGARQSATSKNELDKALADLDSIAAETRQLSRSIGVQGNKATTTTTPRVTRSLTMPSPATTAILAARATSTINALEQKLLHPTSTKVHPHHTVHIPHTLDGSGIIKKQLVHLESILRPGGMDGYSKKSVHLPRPKPLMRKAQTVDLTHLGIGVDPHLALLLKTRKEKFASDDEEEKSIRTEHSPIRLFEEGEEDEQQKMPSVAERIKHMETRKIRFTDLREKAAKRRLARSTDSLPISEEQFDDDDDSLPDVHKYQYLDLSRHSEQRQQQHPAAETYRHQQQPQQQQQQQRTRTTNVDRTFDRLSCFAAISDTGVVQRRRQLQQRQLTRGRRLSHPETIQEINKADSLRSVIAFRDDVIRRTSINPNFGQQFRWIGGMWQKPFPSVRDRVFPANTRTGRHRSKSLPARVSRDIEEGLTGHQRDILLRSAVRPAAHRHHAFPLGASQGVSQQKPVNTCLPQQQQQPSIYIEPSTPSSPGYDNWMSPPAVIHSSTSQSSPRGIGYQQQQQQQPTLTTTTSSLTHVFQSDSRPTQQTFIEQQLQQQQQQQQDKSSFWSSQQQQQQPTQTLSVTSQQSQSPSSPVHPASRTGPGTDSRQPHHPQQQQQPAAAARRKLTLTKKADSFDEDDFDKLVEINYRQLVDSPATQPASLTLSPTVQQQQSPRLSPGITPAGGGGLSPGGPARSPAVSPRLSRRTPPSQPQQQQQSVAQFTQSPGFGRMDSSRVMTSPGGGREEMTSEHHAHQQQQQHTSRGQEHKEQEQEQSEDELSKLSLADKLKLFTKKTSPTAQRAEHIRSGSGSSSSSSNKMADRRQQARYQTQVADEPVTYEELEQVHDWSRDTYNQPTDMFSRNVVSSRPPAAAGGAPQRMIYRDY